jgi:hypothetical protein
MATRSLTGDCRDVLRTVPDDCVVTIPPCDKDHRKFVLRHPCLVCGRVPSDPSIAELQWVIDMIRLPPSPVSVPSIEVAMRLPRFVVVISRSVSRSSRIAGKVA